MLDDFACLQTSRKKAQECGAVARMSRAYTPSRV